MTVGIIDYGLGNLQSVKNALDYLGVKNIISNDIKTLKKTDQLILPGVGAFRDAMAMIKEQAFDKMIQEKADEDAPILGICLGMQLMFDKSYEFGTYDGLSLLEGEIIKFDIPLKVPHMGWNKLNIKKEAPLFKGLPADSYVYFVHSYHLETSADIVSATTTYGKEIQIAAQNKNTFALQFHPEKSGDIGLQILKNFTNI